MLVTALAKLDEIDRYFSSIYRGILHGSRA